MRKKFKNISPVDEARQKRAPKRGRKPESGLQRRNSAPRDFVQGDFVLLQAPSTDELEMQQKRLKPKDLSKSLEARHGRESIERSRPCSESDSFWVAQVVKIWRDEGDQDDRILVKWFYRMKDLYHWHSSVGPDEVFESEHMDENEADCVLGKCQVLCEMDWRMFLLKQARTTGAKANPESPTFLCRERYDFATGCFAPSTMTIKWMQEHRMDQWLAVQSDRSGILGNLPHLALLRRIQNDNFSFDEDDEGVKGTGFDEDPAEVAWSPNEEQAHWTRQRNLGRSSASRRYGTRKAVQREMKSLAHVSHQMLLPAIATGPIMEGDTKEGGSELSASNENNGGFCNEPQISRFWVPTARLPCREFEIDQVMGFLQGCLRGSPERCMYISGVPGTGKTAVVRCAIQQMELKRARGEVPHFQYTEINGMTVPDPYSAYTILLHKLGHRGTCSRGSRRSLAPAEAARLLDRRFRSKSKISKRTDSTLIVLLDEMDALVLNNSSAAQRVLYDFLDWTIQRGSELVVIGIANTLDLPERLLPRLASRLGLNRIVFKPYSKDQVGLILRHRLGPELSRYFHADAIELCTRKIAAISGDIRRAVAICLHAYTVWNRRCRTSDVREEFEASKISAIDVDEAIRELTPSSVKQAIAQLSDIEQIVLLSAALCSRQAMQQESETFRFHQIWNRFQQLYRQQTGQAHSQLGLDLAEQVWHALMRLCSCHLLSYVSPSFSGSAPGSNFIRYSNLSECDFVMNPIFDDVAFALRGHKAFAMLSEDDL
ncbi:hypothetical protein CCYA_CCYA15G3937 [Cyanidiococcus yangmingshanensis]|nr:hypothetical protein CCYA_CCYA15G3937 [Cyanidiococcus yangmingshanensis]